MRLIKLTEERQRRTRNPETQEMNTHTVFIERYLNVEKIENFAQSESDGVTYLWMPSTIYEVVETPEEIIELIKQAKEI